MITEEKVLIKVNDKAMKNCDNYKKTYNYEVSGDKILIENIADFNIRHILECGQVFRFKQLSQMQWSVYSADKYAQVNNYANYVEIVTDDVDYFINYFDLHSDYTQIKRHLIECGKSEMLLAAIDYGYGIRILRQNLNESIFSFIISANNNIKRIQLIIDRLCCEIGEKTLYGYAFPTLEALACQNEAFYSKIGCGYRARYMTITANLIKNGALDGIENMNTAMACKQLKELYGVGQKVADCILLFGMHKGDVFPADVWIKRVYHAAFEQGDDDKNISAALVKRFGSFSGYAQQYLFYYGRENALKA
ncbi:MAG: DNA glycosylase [Clostridia bacterium]